jgi:hypothetical protein
MRQRLSTWVLVAGVGAAMVVQGCKRRTTPTLVQPVVQKIPRTVQPDIPGPWPVEDANQDSARRQVMPRRHPSVDQTHSQVVDTQVAASLATQRMQDARLLQQQQAASQAQQQELNQEVQQEMKANQQMQDEPRIQELPAPPASTGLGPDAPRIQDAPGPMQGQPGMEPPRIQDAPAPIQTQPVP